MPFVAIHKARKPKARVPEVRGYGIADSYVKRFAAAWQMAVKGLASQIDLGAMRKALERQSIQGAIEAIPLYDEGDEKSRKLWGKLGANLRDVFRDLMTAAGQDAYDRLKLPLRFKIEKAKGKGKRVPTVPINPYSARWIEQQAGKLIEGIGDETGDVVRAFILDGFTEGQRAENLIPHIRERVGLFPKWSKAVDNRFALHVREGLSVGEAGRLSEGYRQQLLKKRAIMIARTETITAQAEGRRQAWQIAQESGNLPADIKRRWVAAPASENPDRPCEICLGLDGQVVDINEPYSSDIIGDIMGPVAHPHCRCNELLIRPGEKVPEISTARRAARLAERKKRLAAMKPIPRIKQKPGEKRRPPKPRRARSTDEWVKKMSAEEQGAVRDWAAFTYDSMRRADAGLPLFMEQKAVDATEKKLRAMKKALNRAPQYMGKIYRGMRELSAADVEAMTTVGNEIKLDAISSFSKEEKVGRAFSNPKRSYQGGSILMEVEVTKGAHAIDDARIGGSKREAEVIVLKGKRLRVKKVEQLSSPDPDRPWYHVTLEEVN